MIKHLYDELAKRWLDGCDSIYVISDPHFGDLDSYKFRFPTTFQEGTEYMHDSLVEHLDNMQIKNINSKAGKNSCLIILGDVGDIECVKKLKAKRKILIMGNHDKGASNYKREITPEIIISSGVCKDYNNYEDNHLFDEVYEGPLMINDRVILSHEPIFPTISFLFNIHGHVHNKNYQGDEHHLNVCAEAIDYTPINLINFIKCGNISHIDSIHRMTIDGAIKRKGKK